MGSVRESRVRGQDGTSETRIVPNLEARLGALYSLERLLDESVKDQRAVLETLCAYVRENSALDVIGDEDNAPLFQRGETPPAPTRPGDVQAALTIIGRRPESARTRADKEGWRLDLRNTNLTSYDLSRLNFDRADFSNSFLNGTKMRLGHFVNCVFRHVFLCSSKMAGADFSGSTFDTCHLKQAEIDETNFSSATFIASDLREAHVTTLNINGANLEKAFGYFLEYAVKDAKEKGANSYNAIEILNTFNLIKKATYDEHTVVSESTREAIHLMMSPQIEAKRPSPET